MKVTRWLASLMAVLMVPWVASAVPPQMNVQGQLLNADGQPVDGTYTITFTLYDGMGEAASAVWTETIADVEAVGGLFDELLGAGTVPLVPSVFADHAQLWLGITIEDGPGVAEGGDPELPRKPLATVGYAFSAQHAVTADSANEAQHAISADSATTAGTANSALSADSATTAQAAATADVSLDLACSGCVSGSELDTDFVDTLVTHNDLNAALAGLTTLGNLGCSEPGSVPRWTGSEWTCEIGGGSAPAQPCTGEQQALQWNGSEWQCVILNQTGLSSGQAKGFELKDSWGFAWDGIERQSANWATARADCESRGGRLPTTTELFRVSGAHKSEIGNSYETNYLWSLIPWDETNYTRIRLTDGAVDAHAATSTTAYRCVWPNNTSPVFTGNHCYGPAGEECFTAVAGGGKMFVDKLSRPPVSYVAAMSECNFYHAHLMDMRDYTENVRAGLPNGVGYSGPWHWTADAAYYRSNMIIRWDGVETNWVPYTTPQQTWQVRGGSAYRFRCIGVNTDVGPNPNTFSDEYVADTTTNLKVRTTATSTGHYAAGVNTCFDQGGHYVAEDDTMELVRHGMPNGPGTGSNDYIWTAEHSSHQNINIQHWAGVDRDFTDYHSKYTTWAGPTANYQHRCVFYPLDPDWEPPAPTTCKSDFEGCFSVTRGQEGAELQIVADKFDRTPTKTWAEAVSDCNALGGRLPTAHELTELIRAGLPNGLNEWVWTADTANEGNAQGIILQWDGVNTGFAPVHSSTKTWNGLNASYRYRCVWNNELR